MESSRTAEFASRSVYVQLVLTLPPNFTARHNFYITYLHTLSYQRLQQSPHMEKGAQCVTEMYIKLQHLQNWVSRSR